MICCGENNIICLKLLHVGGYNARLILRTAIDNEIAADDLSF